MMFFKQSNPLVWFLSFVILGYFHGVSYCQESSVQQRPSEAQSKYEANAGDSTSENELTQIDKEKVRQLVKVALDNSCSKNKFDTVLRELRKWDAEFWKNGKSSRLDVATAIVKTELAKTKILTDRQLKLLKVLRLPIVRDPRIAIEKLRKLGAKVLISKEYFFIRIEKNWKGEIDDWLLIPAICSDGSREFFILSNADEQKINASCFRNLKSISGKLAEFSFNYVNPSKRCLNCISNFKKVRILRYQHEDISDLGYASMIQALQKTEKLTLYGDVADKSFRAMTTLKNLRNLEVFCYKKPALLGLLIDSPSLEEASIKWQGCRLKDLLPLGKIKTLKAIHFPPLKSKDFKWFEKFVHVEKVYLDPLTLVCDDELKQIAKLRKLKVLRIQKNMISAKGLKQLVCSP